MSLKSRLGAQPIFLIEIDWNGHKYRLASDAVDVPSNDGWINYTGGLRDFDFAESMNLEATNPEANGLSCACYLDDVDMLLEMARGNTLEGATAEFSYVVYDRAMVSTYEERVILMLGKIQEPQYGDPLEPENFVAFSVLAEPYDESRLMLEPRLKIDGRFSNRDLVTADGKAWPVVFGHPGLVEQADGTETEVFSTPAYASSALSSDIRALISFGEIEATTAKISDELGQTLTKTVQQDFDINGNVYSYLSIAQGDHIAFPGTNVSSSESSREWWCSIDGGISSPYQSGTLKGGADICRWALAKTGQRIDDGAWANLSGVLNRYEFAGFINDHTITAWDWLSGNIIPHLPITVIVGPGGIKPVLIQLWALHLVHPVAEISVGVAQDWLQISAVETIRSTGDLINRSVINYATRGFDDDCTQQVICTAFPEGDGEIGSDYAVISEQRYGQQETTTLVDYVYSRATASRMAMDVVRSQSMPIRSVSVLAGFEWGWLELGDVIEVTISRLHLFSHKMLITGKSWNGQAFEFSLIYEDSHIQNERP